jgi:hypothetical protein
MKRLSKKLIEKSSDAFVMAVEVYNKPSIQYRIEGFSFFYINAWELLLKAYIIETTKKENLIYEKKEKNKIRKTISIRDCLNLVFPETDLTRKNIERIIEIRDSATHFIINELELVYAGLFQSGVLNYLNTLHLWFNFDLKHKFTPGMLSLVSDLKIINPQVIQKNYGKEVLSFIQKEIKRAESDSKLYPDNRYSIPIEYKLVLTKNESDSDIRLSPTKDVDSELNGMFIEVPKNPSLTHPFLFKDIILKISNELSEPSFNSRSFQAIVWKEKIKTNSKYYYQHPKSSTGFYSDKIIDYIKSKIQTNFNYIIDTKEKYSKSLKH